MIVSLHLSNTLQYSRKLCADRCSTHVSSSPVLVQRDRRDRFVSVPVRHGQRWKRVRGAITSRAFFLSFPPFNSRGFVNLRELSLSLRAHEREAFVAFSLPAPPFVPTSHPREPGPCLFSHFFYFLFFFFLHRVNDREISSGESLLSPAFDRQSSLSSSLLLLSVYALTWNITVKL